MVYLFLADGFEDMEATTPFDLLQRAGISVTTVGVGAKTVKSAHGLTVTADISEKEWKPEALEAVIFPGGMPGASNLKKSKTVSESIRFALEKQKIIAAICAAPGVVLEGTGALANHSYTCFPGFACEEGNYTGKTWEWDGNLITANGPGAAEEFSYTLIKALRSKETADSLRFSMNH